MVSRRRVRGEQERRVPGSVIAVLVVFIAALGYLAGTFHPYISSFVGSAFGFKSYGGSLDLSSLQDTYRALKANYDGTIDDKALIEGAQKGLVDALGDEYTVYMNQQEKEAFDNSLSGNIGGGIGVEIGKRNDTLVILRTLKDNPGEKAGLLAGDVLQKINDESVEGKTIEQAVVKIRGEVGTTVKLTVLRDGASMDFTITRAEINNPSVYSTIDGTTGIMTVTRFDDQTGSLARAAAQSFISANVTSVVLDLRGNGGGYVTAAQDLASVWLDDKVVVSERTNGKVVDELRSGSNPILGGIPTVVLVDGSSASASEIVAGALQEHKAAQLVGVKTFGKGSVQKLIALPEGAELKVTTARWYTPNGTNISKQGITPNKIVEITADDINNGRDPQLDAAKGLLQ